MVSINSFVEGNVIDGYRLIRRLGKGGMGEVWEADRLGDRVAIKFLGLQYIEDRDIISRFKHEANTLLDLKLCPYIVHCYTQGSATLQVFSGDAQNPQQSQVLLPYFTMEVLDGVSVAGYMAKQKLLGTAGGLPLSVVLNIAEQCIEGLRKLHEKQIIHRDIKPDNLFLQNTPIAEDPNCKTIKIIDLGIAKDLTQRVGITATGLIPGTLPYIAPEFMQGASASPASDMYALGVTLFEIISGQLPFVGNQQQIIAAKVTQPVPSLVSTHPTVPSWLVDLVERMMAKEPKDRPSMQEILQQIKQERLQLVPSALPAPRVTLLDIEPIRPMQLAPQPVGSPALGTENFSLPVAPEQTTPTTSNVQPPDMSHVARNNTSNEEDTDGNSVSGNTQQLYPIATQDQNEHPYIEIERDNTPKGDTPFFGKRRFVAISAALLCATAGLSYVNQQQQTDAKKQQEMLQPNSATQDGSPSHILSDTQQNAVTKPSDQEKELLTKMVEYASIPAGQFIMGCVDGDAQCQDTESGSNRRLEKVDTFDLMVTEVTIAMYSKCVKAGVCKEPDVSIEHGCNWKTIGRDQHPVNCVDRQQAIAFCQYIDAELPSDVQWEYAAKGGENLVYPWGNTPPDCSKATFEDDGGNGCGARMTKPVCSNSKGKSRYGLCDMAGNVWEWVLNETLSPPTSGEVRGGAWNYTARCLRTSERYFVLTNKRNNYVGFRCAKSKDTQHTR